MLGELHSPIVSGTFRLVVPAAAAGSADLGSAAAASALPAAGLAAHVLWLHHFAASARWANEAASAGVLHVLFGPLLHKVGVKQQSNKLGGDSIVSAASWWHVLLRVSKGQVEQLADARMAHAVAALELGRLAHRGIAVPAAHANGSPTATVRTGDDALGYRTSTDRSAGFPGRKGRVEGAASSAKKVERFVDELRL